MMSQKDVCFSSHLLALLISVQLKLALFTLSEELLAAPPHAHVSSLAIPVERTSLPSSSGKRASGGLRLARWSQEYIFKPINIAKTVRLSDWPGLSHMHNPVVGQPSWLNHVGWNFLTVKRILLPESEWRQVTINSYKCQMFIIVDTSQYLRI